jgi:hypothetical protein
MDEAYMKSLEKRNAELVDKLEQVSALLNSYQKMVKFEIHVQEFIGPISFDPQKSVSLVVNNGARSRMFAHVTPSNNAIGHGGWDFIYSNPFEDGFTQEKQKNKMTMMYPQVMELYKKYCIDHKLEYDQKYIDKPEAFLSILAMDLTGTSHVEYKLTSLGTKYH